MNSDVKSGVIWWWRVTLSEYFLSALQVLITDSLRKNAHFKGCVRLFGQSGDLWSVP